MFCRTCFFKKPPDKINEEIIKENELLNILFEQLFESGKYKLREQYNSRESSNLNMIKITNFNEWSFDPLNITLSNISTFADIFLYVINDMNLQCLLLLKHDTLDMFALEVSQLYHDSTNPYHNIKHAVHVFHSIYMMLKCPENELFCKENPLLSLCILIAAFCHDIDHCGNTNSYLIATKHIKSVKFKGFSPQEMHHVSVTLNLIDKCKILDNTIILPNEIIFKEWIVKLILATNIADHNTIIDTFDPNNSLKRAKLMLKCADLSHTFADLSSHKLWTTMLQSEFFIQGDKEKVYNLPVTKMFDRNYNHIMIGTQTHFFNLIVIPMFNILFESYPSLIPHMKEKIEINLKYWEEQKTSSSYLIKVIED